VRYCYLAYFTMLDIIGREMVINDILIAERIIKQRKNIGCFSNDFSPYKNFVSFSPGLIAKAK